MAPQGRQASPDGGETQELAENGGGGFPLRDQAYEQAQVIAASAPLRRRLDPWEPWLWLLAVGLLALLVLGGAYVYSRKSSGHAPTPRAARATPPAPAEATVPRPKPEPAAPIVDPAAARRSGSHPAAETVTVPTLVGDLFPHALSALRAAGLTATVSHVSSSRPAGAVVAQRPTAGTKLAAGASVQLDVSQPPPATVPDVAGMALSAAVKALRRRHLLPSIRRVPNRLKPGTVVAQSPDVGTELKRGAHVFMTVSRGGAASSTKAGPGSTPQPPPVSTSATATVPGVVGEDELAARSDLEAAGYSIDAVDSPTSDPGQDGLVLEQDPPAGSEAEAGSTVAIYVGRYSAG